MSEGKTNMMTGGCANCGVKGSSDISNIKLMMCGACNSIQYCSIKCQKEHWPKHKQACKERVAELAALRDEILFRQPEGNHLGDCPICCVPLPLDEEDKELNRMTYCCSKVVCHGCKISSLLRTNEKKCVFCRQVAPRSTDEAIEKVMKRVEVNDPVALYQMGELLSGRDGGPTEEAIQFFSRAAALGNIEAHYALGMCLMKKYYENTTGDTENKIRWKKMMFHYEEAAIAGHPGARYLLAEIEQSSEHHERSVKHLLIASRLGHNRSLEILKNLYAEKKGVIKKDDLASVIREYQAVVDATISASRFEARVYDEVKDEVFREVFDELCGKVFSLFDTSRVPLPNGIRDRTNL